MSVVNILRIESLTYGVDDLEVGQRYYDDWGLVPQERGRHGADYALPSGQTIRLRAMDDGTLPPAIEGGSTIREVTWGVDSANSLAAVGTALARDRDLGATNGTIRTSDPAVMGVAFTVGTPAAIPPLAAPRPRNVPFEVAARIAPRRIGHAVFNIAAGQMQATASFYLDRLGFRLSEHVTDFGDFMRCPGSTDHHNLFLLQRPAGGLNHVAFEVENLDEIVVGGKYMQERGWQPATTLGRHIMGSNIFWYFANPSGGLAEYYSDMDVMDDNWQPRMWDANPGFARWMT